MMERTIYDIRQKIEWDNKNVHDFEIEEAQEKGERVGLERGLERGLARGLERGKYEKAVDMAKILKQKGVAVALIKEASGLSDLEIQSL
jgi:predicted transposase YdaD